MPPKDKYTDPKLREEVKEEIKEGDKGGQPGQWSARKAQMMASEYKKRGKHTLHDHELILQPLTGVARCRRRLYH